MLVYIPRNPSTTAKSVTFDCTVPIRYTKIGGDRHGDTPLYRVGELAKLTQTSPRTIDYYTQLGLIHPVKRSDSQYRYYNDETIARLKRITLLKKEKYKLEEIRTTLNTLDRVSSEQDVADKLTSLQLHMQQLEKEVKELEPLIRQLKPNQAKKLFQMLAPQGAACMQAILILLDKGPLL